MLRERIKEQYGADCRIVTVKRAPCFGSFLFVVDFPHGGQTLRILGSLAPGIRITEQSAMDLMHPERLVFAYERLMLAAFALAARPRSALLLGLGGGAMCRHLDAYLPACALTVVEHDPVVVELARRHFHLTRPVVRADAREVVADRRGAFDVVLVDLYDARGAAAIDPGFWEDCAATLAPGGCLAVNWAEFVADDRARGEADAIAAAVGRSFFLGERGARANVVQVAPTMPDFRLAALPDRLRAFAEAHRLPHADRSALARCVVMSDYPGSIGKPRTRRHGKAG